MDSINSHETVFRHLTQEERDMLNEQKSCKTYKKGSVIY